MSLIDNIAKMVLNKATLLEKRKIADETYHLILIGDDLKKMNYKPGEQIKILVGVDKSMPINDKTRTYSVWNYEPEQGIVDLAVSTFSSGPGARWVKELHESDTVYFSSPKGRFTIDNTADYYLMIGDVSALAHLYEINRHIAPDKKVYGLIFSEVENDFYADFTGDKPFAYFTEDRLNMIDRAIKFIQPIIEKEQGKGMVYVGGEAGLCLHLNQYFKHTLGWSSRQIKTKPFWHPHKTGLE